MVTVTWGGHESYSESWWVDDRVDHDNLLEESRHCSKRVPEHRSEVRDHFSFSTQLYQRVFSCFRISKLQDPRIYLGVCIIIVRMFCKIVVGIVALKSVIR